MNEIHLVKPVFYGPQTPTAGQTAVQNVDNEIKKIAATIQNPLSIDISTVAKPEFEKTQQAGKDKSNDPIKPNFLFCGEEIKKEEYLDFALLDIDGLQKLLPVTTDMDGKNYKVYEGSALEALLKLSQDRKKEAYYFASKKTESPISFVLKHPNNSIIREDDFIKFIFKKDANGNPRFLTLNQKAILDLLKLIKEKKIAVNLQDTDARGSTLLNRWAGTGKIPLTRLILKLAPTIIKQSLESNASLFANTVFRGYQKEADLLLDAMKKQNIQLSQEDQWMKRVLKRDFTFSDKAFAQLPQKLKSEIYYAANALGVKPLVKRLRSLGMKKVPLYIPGPSTFALNMDIITVRYLMNNFLKKLRKEGALLTYQEFDKLDRTQYVEKANQIGRIQGKHFIEKLVKENGLKHIKVPKKIVVMHGNPDRMSLRIHYTGELLPYVDDHDYIKVYAERIEPVKRKLSYDEAIEWMIILEKTGYQDFTGENFFICKDGIYFIDTEFENFKPSNPKFYNIKSLKKHLDRKDVPAFLEAFHKREKAFEERDKPGFIISSRDMLINGYALKRRFIFPLKSLAKTGV